MSGLEALGYLDKLRLQLHLLGLLTGEDEAALAAERAAWAVRLAQFPDRQVLVHGDATPTNFLFPDNGGRGRPPTAGGGPGPGAPAGRRPPLGPLLGGRRTQARLGLAHRPGGRGRRGHRPFFPAYLGPQPDTRTWRTPLSPQPLLHGPGGAAHRPQCLSAWDYRRWLVAEADGAWPTAGGYKNCFCRVRVFAVSELLGRRFYIFAFGALASWRKIFSLVVEVA